MAEPWPCREWRVVQLSTLVFLCARLAGQMLPFGATYFPVFSHAASLNESKQAARGEPHFITQIWALLLHVSACANVMGLKTSVKSAILEMASFTF
jgi:hypothetical protein